MFCIPNGQKRGSMALKAVALSLICIALGTPRPLVGQAGGPDAPDVLRRLGIPATRLAEIPEQGLRVDCQPGAATTVCELRFHTDSDEVCRAVAVREALRRRSTGSQEAVITRVTCGSGIVAVFQAGMRRGIMSYKDARGNTARREFPL